MSKSLVESKTNDELGYRVLFIVDATGSMGAFLNSLTVSLYQVASIMKLTTQKKSEIGILWYRDYDQPIDKVTNFSGYTTDMNKISTFLADLQPIGGGDTPEATKTALNKVLDMNLVDSNTIVLIYADAPPHHPTTQGSSWALEQINVKEKDWIQLCKLYQKTGCKVFSIINSMQFQTSSFYILLSQYTQGRTFCLTSTDVKTISKATINLFLSLCNAEYESTDLPRWLNFININVADFDNEDDAQYEDQAYLPSTKSKKLASINMEAFSAEAIKFMEVDLRFMLDKFEKDDEYKSVVYQILESLMTPQHILAVTHNSILGLLWRLVCKQKKDTRRDQLILTLSQTLNTMGLNPALAADTAIVRAWVEESYNAREEIINRIAEITEQVPAIVLTLDKKMTRTELLEITRSCNAEVLRKVMSLLNHLTVVTNKSNLSKNYLPLKMNDGEIFELLPHLLADGLKFSLRPAALMAMLCVLSKNGILQERAVRFLTSIKGKWLDLASPENNAYAFSKICVKLPEFFTDEENLFFQKLYVIGGLKLNAATRITIQKPFSPKVNEIHYDTKIQCTTCNIARSTTLFSDVGTSCCALCLPQYNLKYTPEPCAEDKSHLVECGTCNCLYAIVQYAQLYARPKCFYCRELLQTTPYRRCTACQNKYVHFDSTELVTNNGEEKTFICAECKHSTTNQSIIDIQVPISTLIDENKTQIYNYLNIKIKDDINIFSAEWSLFKLKDKMELESREDAKLLPVPLTHNKKPVLNYTLVFDQIQAWIQSGKSEHVTCYICCNDVPRNRIDDTCGNKSCHAGACIECLTSWYEAVKPGGIVLVSHLSCPFCKQAPLGKILKKYNKQACTILRPDKKNDIDEHWYYGWCLDCYKVQKAQEKICSGNDDIPELTNFVCDDCAEVRKISKSANSKFCPGINENTKEICGIAISKNGGCNHITCTACNSHWCWLCVKIYGDSIYEHLTEVHGNYGLDDNENEY
ncbi:unnamed protein product [Rotaria socialis]|uniref:RING-type domain-containing protein n=1 Tax=Rotaria socialis TaxID=392032 RepID=A0A820P979_9BILA|nr:unnamed protein product [Rotaria socialis]CAF3619954.1 unnamed protein product [Rotaria socialis]CAF4190456.1 unnamed protein product [Rotaria socialis]CAF4403050.1 unnamed protein product [Rotaria socialis]